jgi:hypothetical protein
MWKQGTVPFMGAALLLSGVLAGAASSSPTQSRVQDRCLVGQWRMSRSASTAMLQSLIGSSQFTVAEGVITAAFPRNDRMRYGSTHFVVKMTAGPLVMKGSATFYFEAGWRTAGGKLVLDAGRSELVVSKLSATKDGKTVTVDGPPPTRRRTSPGATPYTCTRTTLRWKIPVNDAWALFRRVR